MFVFLNPYHLSYIPLSVVKMVEVEQSSCCIFLGSLIHMCHHLWNTKEEEDALLYRRCY